MWLRMRTVYNGAVADSCGSLLFLVFLDDAIQEVLFLHR